MCNDPGARVGMAAPGGFDKSGAAGPGVQAQPCMGITQVPSCACSMGCLCSTNRLVDGGRPVDDGGRAMAGVG